MSVQTMKSLLFVPGDRPDRFSKASAAGADAIILDIEDSVAPQDKPRAREETAQWLSQRPGWVRLNARETEFHEDDLAALRSAPGLAGVVVPTCETSTDLELVRTHLPDVPLIALVETALGVEQAPRLARLPSVARLAFGSIDFALDARIRPTTDEEPELDMARWAVVLASRAAGLPSPIDGVCADIVDDEALRQVSRRSYARGFGGRLCIHPSQVSCVNQAYAPAAEDIAWARRVLRAAEEHHGAFRLENRMIDQPVIELARSYIEHQR